MKYSEIMQECRTLAKEQNLTFKRSKMINKINNKACYEILSHTAVLHQGSIITIWETLLSGNLANK